MPTTEQEFARLGLADEYFGRVNYTGSARATVATLHALVSAHTRVENSDSLLGRPVADLGSEALVDKLVRHFRGGFCYEQKWPDGVCVQGAGIYRRSRGRSGGLPLWG